MYSCQITAPDAELLERCFSAEPKGLRERSEWAFRREGDMAIFSITAQDASALRAEFNSLMKSLAVVDKVKVL